MYLKDRLTDPYPWFDIKNQSQKLLYELSLAEDEEETELYAFKLYLQDREGLSVFTPEEQNQIKKYFAILIADTRKHAALFRRMIMDLKRLADTHDVKTLA